jgi:hypothetical protein
VDCRCRLLRRRMGNGCGRENSNGGFPGLAVRPKLATPVGRGLRCVSVLDGLADLVTGRGPLNNLDQPIRDWRTGGGDQIRTEFQQAYAESKS